MFRKFSDFFLNTPKRKGESQCKIYYSQSGNGAGFSPMYFGFPLSVSFQQPSILSFILILFLSEGQAGEDWELKISSALSATGEGGKKSTTTLDLQGLTF
jgi:hypothetical protein